MAESRKDGVKLAAVNQAVLAQGHMDLSGFRIGKTRLVSKQKKVSNLKKVILEERSDRKGSDGTARLPASGSDLQLQEQQQQQQRALVSRAGLSLDAPEFIPMGWAFTPAVSSTAPPAGGGGATGGSPAIAGSPSAGAQPAAASGAGDEVAGADLAAAASPGSEALQEAAPSDVPAAGVGVVGVAVASAGTPASASATAAASSPPVFMPSWCQGAISSASFGSGAAAATAAASSDGPSTAADPAAAGEAAAEGRRGDSEESGADSDEGGGDGAARVRAAGGGGPAAGGAIAAAGEGDDLPVAEAIERIRAMQEGGGRQAPRDAKKPGASSNVIEVRHYVHQVLSDELDEKVKEMLAELVRFQERAKERDPLKYQKQKRLCVGMREAKRNVLRGKAKCIIGAPNLEECSTEGGLDDTVEGLIEVCREQDVPVVFALSRNRLGKALGKSIRLSIVCVLSAEGVHQELKQVLKLTDELRRQWVFRQMMHVTSDDAEEARKRAEEKALRDAARRETQAKREAERKVEEERLRAEAKAAKEAEKARKAALREAEIERRRAAKAQREQAQKRDAAENAEADAARREAGAARAEELRAQREAAELEAAERRREAARRLAEEEALRAKATAALQAQAARAAVAAAVGTKKVAAEDESDAESDSSGSSVPLGFNAGLF